MCKITTMNLAEYEEEHLLEIAKDYFWRKCTNEIKFSTLPASKLANLIHSATDVDKFIPENGRKFIRAVVDHKDGLNSDGYFRTVLYEWVFNKRVYYICAHEYISSRYSHEQVQGKQHQLKLASPIYEKKRVALDHLVDSVFPKLYFFDDFQHARCYVLDHVEDKRAVKFAKSKRTLEREAREKKEKC